MRGPASSLAGHVPTPLDPKFVTGPCRCSSAHFFIEQQIVFRVWKQTPSCVRRLLGQKVLHLLLLSQTTSQPFQHSATSPMVKRVRESHGQHHPHSTWPLKLTQFNLEVSLISMDNFSSGYAVFKLHSWARQVQTSHVGVITKIVYMQFTLIITAKWFEITS